MRLWVRSGVQINLSFGFSRAVESASDTSNDKVLQQPIIFIARQLVGGSFSAMVPRSSAEVRRVFVHHIVEVEGVGQ